jgi:phage shock protein C
MVVKSKLKPYFWRMNKRLTKSNDKLIAGVCGGIADYFGWDLSMVRVGYVLLSIFSAGFPGFLAYIILWIVMPRY